MSRGTQGIVAPARSMVITSHRVRRLIHEVGGYHQSLRRDHHRGIPLV